MESLKFVAERWEEIPEDLFDQVAGGKSFTRGKSVLNLLGATPRTKTRKTLYSNKTTEKCCVGILTGWKQCWRAFQGSKDIESSAIVQVQDYISQCDKFVCFTNVSDMTNVEPRKHKTLFKKKDCPMFIVCEMDVKDLYWIDTKPVDATDTEYTELGDKVAVMSKYLNNNIWLMDVHDTSRLSVVAVYGIVEQPSSETGFVLDELKSHNFKHYIKNSTIKDATINRVKKLYDKELLQHLKGIKIPKELHE